jgi:hypothetical protein
MAVDRQSHVHLNRLREELKLVIPTKGDWQSSFHLQGNYDVCVIGQAGLHAV